MESNPLFIQFGNSFPCLITSANTASDGSGALFDLVTAGSGGTRIDQIIFRNAQTTAQASLATLGKIFLSDNSGMNFNLIGEIAIPSVTRSATVIGASATYTFSPPLFINAGQKISVASSALVGNKDYLSVLAFGGDF